jgi:hypothetical protein
MKELLSFGVTPRVMGLGLLLLAWCIGGIASEALPASSAPAAVNLIQDPGFETGPGTLTRTTSPWVGEETNVAHIVSDGHAHSGAQEAVFQPGSVANQGQLMQMFNVAANTDYTASAWIGGTPGFSTVGQPANNDTTGKPTQRGFGIHIPSAVGTDPDGDGDTQGFDASIIIKYVTITNNSSGSYQFYSFTFNSGAHTKLFVDFDANLPANGVLRIDDVSVTDNTGTATPPAITTQPANQTVSVGHAATFNVAASGTSPLSYQWQKNGTTIAGATSASYTTPVTALSDNGSSFQVIVTNSAGSVTSPAAILTVTSTTGAPTITTQPVNQPVTVGRTATFSVTAAGTAPLSYQWQKNGTSIAGATSASYTTPATTLPDSGSTFRVIVSNSAGTVTSTSATLTVNPPGGGTLPSHWQDLDIGPVGVAGSATDSSGIFAIQGAGADIGGTADSFNYLFQPLTGDGTIIVQVSSLGNTAPGAQVGVMIRESLSPDSPFADMLITPGGASFQGRIQPGSPNFNDGGPVVTAPYWLKITRTGDVFVGSTSSDGLTWTQAGTATIPMPQTVLIGIAVTSHTTSVATTAMVDSVSGSGGWQSSGSSGGSGSGGGAPGGGSGSGGGGCGLTGVETLLILGVVRLLVRRKGAGTKCRVGGSRPTCSGIGLEGSGDATV